MASRNIYCKKCGDDWKSRRKEYPGEYSIFREGVLSTPQEYQMLCDFCSTELNMGQEALAIEMGRLKAPEKISWFYDFFKPLTQKP